MSKTKSQANNIVNWHSPHVQKLFDEKKKKNWSPTKLLNEIEKLTGARPERKITQQQARRYYEMREKVKNSAKSLEFNADRIANDKISDSPILSQSVPDYFNYNAMPYYDLPVSNDQSCNENDNVQYYWYSTTPSVETWNAYDHEQNYNYGQDCHTQQTDNQTYCDYYFYNSYDPMFPHSAEESPQLMLNDTIDKTEQSIEQRPKTSTYPIIQISETVTLTVLEPKM